VVAAIGWNIGAIKRGRNQNPADVLMPSMKREGTEKIPTFFDQDDHTMTVPIVMQVYTQFAQDVSPQELDHVLGNLRRRISQELGVPFPGMLIRPVSDLAEGSLILCVNEIPIVQTQILPGHVFCFETQAVLNTAGIATAQPDNLLGRKGVWVPLAEESQLMEKNYPFLSPEQVIEQYIQRLIEQHAYEFIGIQETQLLLNRLQDQYPDLEKELKQQVPLPRLSDVLRRLLQEQISIRDLRLIAQTLVETAAREKDNVMLTEYVRNAMVRAISYRYTSSNGELAAIVVAPTLEDQIKQYLKQSGVGSVLLLPETIRLSIRSQIQRAVADIGNNDNRLPVLLVNAIEIRSHLRAALATDFPDLVVLAAPQIEGSVRVIIKGQVQ